jgi:hypothetical protein
VPRAYSLSVRGRNTEGLDVVEIMEEYSEDQDLSAPVPAVKQFASESAPAAPTTMPLLTPASPAHPAPDAAEMWDEFAAGFDAQYAAQMAARNGPDTDGEWLDSLYQDDDEEAGVGAGAGAGAASEIAPVKERRKTVPVVEDDDEEEAEAVNADADADAISVVTPGAAAAAAAAPEQGISVAGHDTVDFEAMWRKLDYLQGGSKDDAPGDAPAPAPAAAAAAAALTDLPEPTVSAPTGVDAAAAAGLTDADMDEHAAALKAKLDRSNPVNNKLTANTNTTNSASTDKKPSAPEPSLAASFGLGLSPAMARALALMDEDEDDDEDFDDGGFYRHYAEMLAGMEGEEGEGLEAYYEDEDEVEGVVVGGEDPIRAAFEAYGGARSGVRIVDDEEEDEGARKVTFATEDVVGSAAAVDLRDAADDDYVFGLAGAGDRLSKHTVDNTQVFGSANGVLDAPSSGDATPKSILKKPKVDAAAAAEEPVEEAKPAAPAVSDTVTVRVKPKKKKDAIAAPVTTTKPVVVEKPAAGVSKDRDMLANLSNPEMYQSLTVSTNGKVEPVPSEGALGMSKFKAKRLGLLRDDE